MIPSIKQQTRPATSGAGLESPVVNRREQRRSVDLGSSLRARRTSSSLHDEINTLQVENDSMYEKFNLAEERSEDGDVKSMHMAAVIADAIEPEANLISRKDAALEQRKAALRIASRRSNSASCDEITTLRSEAKAANSVARSASQRLKSTGSDIRSLQGATNRMVLSQEEMEEVVLKRCWLARYWKLCVRLDIHSDIAEEKQDYWSSFAPLSLEVVLSIGQKARDGTLSDNADMETRSKMSDASHLNDMTGDGNIENMLLVERGLRELASLKVEDAIMLALAEHRRIKPLSDGALVHRIFFLLDYALLNDIYNFWSTYRNCITHINGLQLCMTSSFIMTKHPITTGPASSEELSEEEQDDVRFKQAWLTYFWRRAKNHDIEEDIADERLQFWIEQGNHPVGTIDVIEAATRCVQSLAAWFLSFCFCNGASILSRSRGESKAKSPF
uniref:Uncharacterized protein n=1 Tax=Oryza brachyantha TaxID=4533 RepID=J3M3Z2_ORYBR